MEPIQPRKARMKPNSCRPALAMARSGARAGSGLAGVEGGEFAGAHLRLPKVTGPSQGSYC